jgi:hypothetical protein
MTLFKSYEHAKLKDSQFGQNWEILGLPPKRTWSFCYLDITSTKLLVIKYILYIKARVVSVCHTTFCFLTQAKPVVVMASSLWGQHGGGEGLAWVGGASRGKTWKLLGRDFQDVGSQFWDLDFTQGASHDPWPGIFLAHDFQDMDEEPGDFTVAEGHGYPLVLEERKWWLLFKFGSWCMRL